MVLEERIDHRVAQAVGVGRVEHGEPRAVEAHRPFIRTEPQIAVARRRDGEHGVLRQSIVLLPEELLIAAEDVVTAGDLCRRWGRTREENGEAEQHGSCDRDRHVVRLYARRVEGRDWHCAIDSER